LLVDEELVITKVIVGAGVTQNVEENTMNSCSQSATVSAPLELEDPQAMGSWLQVLCCVSVEHSNLEVLERPLQRLFFTPWIVDNV